LNYISAGFSFHKPSDLADTETKPFKESVSLKGYFFVFQGYLSFSSNFPVFFLKRMQQVVQMAKIAILLNGLS